MQVRAPFPEGEAHRKWDQTDRSECPAVDDSTVPNWGLYGFPGGRSSPAAV